MSETSYSERSDAVDDKLQLLRQAYAQGDVDVAMSLCESIKDTLSCERQFAGPAEAAGSGADAFALTDTLPTAWAQATTGWRYFKVLVITEPAGLARCGEPVDVAIACGAEQVADLRREIRLVRVDDGLATAREVACQVYAESCCDGVRHGRLVFLADVPAGTSAYYLVLYGNAGAQLPSHPTDLQVTGEGYALSIDNHHYGAHLCSHTGQLQRLAYSSRSRSIVDSPRNQLSSGLELYAGGEGHGESPHLDWAHDYAAAGQFQKFRMTHWARCPNYEVVRGPLCVKVRRWGFPHGPAHPLFTPSRLHMDVTYTFYAGLPWFIKESRMTVLRNFTGAVRDDEWVVTGQPFTDTLWMDRDGLLHEGPVAPGHEEHVWGLGFFHGQTRDAFLALFLEHTAEGCDTLVHGGAAQLDYQGIPRHAQLWSRSPTRDQPLKAGAVLSQRNAYLVSPYDDAESPQRLRRLLMQPLQARSGELPAAVAATAAGLTLRTSPAEVDSALKESIWDALRQVRDDMFYTVDANVVDMGYIYDVSVVGDVVSVLMTMPHRGRPRFGFLVGPLREQLLELDGVRDVVVDCTWEPPWSVARLTAKGRAAMGLTP